MSTPETTIPSHNESVWEETGYSKPYDPSDMTDDQAATLYDQNIGGADTARQARRAADRAFFDKDIGQPDGTTNIIKSPREDMAATKLWEAHNNSEIEILQAKIDTALKQSTGEAPQLRAKLERRLKTAKDISTRLQNLELPVRLLDIDDDIAATTKRHDDLEIGHPIRGRESNRLYILGEQRKNTVANLRERSKNIE